MMDYSSELLELRNGPFVPTKRTLEDPSLLDNHTRTNTKKILKQHQMDHIYDTTTGTTKINNENEEEDGIIRQDIDRAILDDLLQWTKEEEELYNQWEEKARVPQELNNDTTSNDCYSEEVKLKEEDTYLTQEEHDTMTALLDEFLFVVPSSFSKWTPKFIKRRRPTLEEYTTVIVESKKRICRHFFCDKPVRARGLCCRHVSLHHCIIPKCRRLRHHGHFICHLHKKNSEKSPVNSPKSPCTTTSEDDISDEQEIKQEEEEDEEEKSS